MPVDLNRQFAGLVRETGSVKRATLLFSERVRAQALAGDLLSYGLYVHGNQDPALRDLCFSPHAWIQAERMERSLRTLVVSHPQSGKTALARWATELHIGMATEAAFARESATVPSALYLMATFERQAEPQSMEIRNTVSKSKRFQELFPHARPDRAEKWEKGAWYLQRPPSKTRPEPSLLASGIGGDIQGLRFTFEVIDDPVDQERAQSEAFVQRAVDFILGTVEARAVRNLDVPIAYRFTRWSPRDAFDDLSPSCDTVVMPITGFWEAHPEYAHLWEHHPLGPKPPDTLWPYLWPRKAVDAEHRKWVDAGRAGLWAMVYMCDPAAAEGGIIKRVWFGYALPRESPDRAEKQQEEVAV